jgi:hypothetical protein
MTYTAPKRNFDNIQFAAIRKVVDKKYNDCHDELTRCFKGGVPFKYGGHDYGVLTKEQFDRLHGLIFHLREVAFHNANLKASAADKADEAKYRFADNGDGTQTDRVQEAIDKIKELKSLGIELVI